MYFFGRSLCFFVLIFTVNRDTSNCFNYIRKHLVVVNVGLQLFHKTALYKYTIQCHVNLIYILARFTSENNINLAYISYKSIRLKDIGSTPGSKILLPIERTRCSTIAAILNFFYFKLLLS